MDRRDTTTEETLQSTVDKHGEILDEIKETLQKMNEKLDPIVETYSATRLLGKWVMAVLLFASLVGGILVEWRHWFK